MNTWRSCLCLGLLFYATAKAFDYIIPLRPSGEFWDMSYYGFAATFDLMLFRAAPRFVSGNLLRDVQALSIAFIVTNAFGYAQYLAFSPPSTYNRIIQGINHVLAIRLIITGGGDAINNFDWRGVVRGYFLQRNRNAIEKADR